MAAPQNIELLFKFPDGHTVERMRVVWKKGFDQSKVTENNYISLTQLEYAVFFEENYEEEIASGKAGVVWPVVNPIKHFTLVMYNCAVVIYVIF